MSSEAVVVKKELEYPKRREEESFEIFYREMLTSEIQRLNLSSLNVPLEAFRQVLSGILEARFFI